MAGKLPTIRDVARRAGVGIGTVSRVLNESPQVTDHTRAKVLAAIEELHFSPNVAARQLSGGKTDTIGVVTAFFTYPSFVQRLVGVQHVLDESDYELVLYSIRTLEQLQRSLELLATQNRVDGLIVLSLPFSEDKLHALNPDLRVVVVDNESITRYPHLMIDNVAGGELATNYLIDKGHRDLGFIGDRLESSLQLMSTPLRHEGFQRALQQAGLPLNEAWCAFVDHSEAAARTAAREMLSQPQRPRAVVVAIDTLAFGVLAAADDLGLRVPEDVAIIGFDDIDGARYMRLTTIRQPLIRSGELGAQLLLDWLRTGALLADQWKTMLPLEVVERATV